MEDDCLYYDDDYNEEESVQQGLLTHSFSKAKDNNNICTTLSIENTKTTSLSELMELLLNDAEKVSSVTCFSLAASILLLKHCKWLVEVAKEAYFENPERMLQNLKLTVDTAQHVPTFVTNAQKIECLICSSEANENEAIGLLSCNHFFHRDCWKALIRYKLDNKENICNFRCPMDGCLELVDVHSLKELFSTDVESPLCSKIERLFLSNYIDTSPRLCWCPNDKGCEGILYTFQALHPFESVECNLCHLRFCFRCKKMPHSPAFCDQIQQWTDILNQNVPNIAFVLINTKACPSCHARIQKNMGCNHMTCICGYEFCWICLGKWSSHSGSYFSCNNAKSNLDQESNGKQNDQIRFFNHYQKYMIQKDSRKKECATLDMLANRTLDFAQTQENLYTFLISPDFLAHLLEDVKSSLSIARESLAFAVVRSYYSDNSQHETQLFLFRMGSLEEATETLSHHLSTLKSNAPINIKELQEEKNMVRRWVLILQE